MKKTTDEAEESRPINSPALLELGGLPLSRHRHGHVRFPLHLLLLMPLLLAVDFPQLLQGIMGYGKGHSEEGGSWSKGDGFGRIAGDNPHGSDGESC